MITVNDLKNRDNFFLMAGPCAIEGEDMALRIAEKVVGITNKLNIGYSRNTERVAYHAEYFQCFLIANACERIQPRTVGFPV